jgi:orotate phosphoribosyltransferase
MNAVEIMQECRAMLTGHFLLSSGNHSPHYFQCARLLQYPDKAAEVMAVCTEKIAAEKKAGRLDFDVVIGPAMGGILPAYELARQLGVPAMFTERDDNGNMTLRRGFEITAGTKVLIAEDVITTGKSTLEAARCISEAGGTITASACIVDRRPETAENPFSWPIFAAIRQSAVLYEPGNCPLCSEAAVPLVKPGSRKIFN